MYQRTWRCSGIFDNWCEFRILADVSWQRRSYIKRCSPCITDCCNSFLWPLDLKTLLDTFKQVIEAILATIKCQFAFVCFDDIITFSKLRLETFKHVRQVVYLWSRARVGLRFKKCPFFTDSIHYVGRIIPCSELQMTTHTSDDTPDLREPRDVTKHWSFLGRCNTFHRFMPSLLELLTQWMKSCVTSSHKLLIIIQPKRDLQWRCYKTY